MLEFDENGFDRNGFNKKGIHKDTGTRFDLKGYDCQGYDEYGLNIYGFTRDGHGYTVDKNGDKVLKLSKVTTRMCTKENEGKFNHNEVNPRGFFYMGKNIYCRKKDPQLGDQLAEHDRRGFLFDGTNIETGTPYNKYGYNAYGINIDGYDEYGFNKEGINEYTGTDLDLDGNDFVEARAYKRRKMKMPEGLDEYGFDEFGLWNGTSRYSKETGLNVRGIDKDGFNMRGINKEGVNRAGFRRNGIHIETNSYYDPEGYDIKRI